MLNTPGAHRAHQTAAPGRSRWRSIARASVAAAALGLAGGMTACSPSSSSTPTGPTAPAIFTGRIISTPSGQGISGARVAVEGSATSVLTTADGTFTLTANPGDRITVTADGHVDRATKLAATIDMIADRPPFSADVYRTFVRGGQEGVLAGNPPTSLNHWLTAPALRLVTTDVFSGAPVGEDTLRKAEDAFRSMLPAITGDKFQLSSVERVGSPGRALNAITVDFEVRTELIAGRGCSTAFYPASFGAGQTSEVHIVLAPGCPRDFCSLHHEYLHALGFYHIGPVDNTFFGRGTPNGCSTADARVVLSDTEKLIGAIAYSRPNGNAHPDRDP